MATEIAAGVALSGKASVIVPPLGGFAISVFLAELFGPNINLAAAIAGIVGMISFYVTPIGKQYSQGVSANGMIVSAFTLWMGSMYLSQAAYLWLAPSWPKSMTTHMIPPMCFLISFSAKAGLTKLVEAIKSFSFSWRGFLVGKEPVTTAPATDPSRDSPPAEGLPNGR
jgi:hypothetical protein